MRRARPSAALVLVADDALDEVAATSAGGAGSTGSSDGRGRGGSSSNDVANLSIGDGVAVANQHGRLSERPGGEKLAH